MKKIMKIFKYPSDMSEKIIEHEEMMEILYTRLIEEKYKALFESYGCMLKVGLDWENFSGCSKKRVAFKPGYSCSVYCKVQKEGEVARVTVNDEYGGYYLLQAAWNISRVEFPFSIDPYVLISDIDDVYDEMDELAELISEYYP